MEISADPLLELLASSTCFQQALASVATAEIVGAKESKKQRRQKKERKSLQACNLCNWNDRFLNGEVTITNYSTLSGFKRNFFQSRRRSEMPIEISVIWKNFRITLFEKLWNK